MNDPAGTKKRKGLGFLKRYITWKLVLAAAATAACLVVGVGLGTYFSEQSKTAELGFEDIGELATQVAYCTEVNITQAARELWGLEIPFTQSKYIYSYDVEVKAGLDFGEIEWTADEENRTIEVKLPEVRVLSCELDTDSFQLYHEAESIFRRISMEENNEALKGLKETAQADAVANGLLENARSNAEAMLTGFFAGAYDLEEYAIRYTDK